MRESAVSSSSPNATHGIDTVKIMINASVASEMRLNRDPAVETDAPFAALPRNISIIKGCPCLLSY